MKTILTILAASFAFATFGYTQTVETYDKDAEKLGKIQRAAAMDLSKYENMARKYDEKLADLIGEVVVPSRHRPENGQHRDLHHRTDRKGPKPMRQRLQEVRRCHGRTKAGPESRTERQPDAATLRHGRQGT